jgi:hypothetical protein
VKSLTKLIKVLLNDRPAFFNKVSIKAIRARRFIPWEISDHIINFFMGEGFRKAS